MFNVISPGAQYAVETMSDWLSDAQVPSSMPDPNDAARKQSSKKTPEKTKVADLTTQRLAKRRSQDFASKIAGWNELGGGIVAPEPEKPKAKPKSKKQSENEIVVIHDDASDATHHDMIVVETESTIPGDVIAFPVRSRPTTPNTPRTPGKAPAPAPNAVAIVPSGEKKAGREVDLDRKAWVRRKSKPQVEVPAEVKEASAPKKRVVSDGHWRRDRTAVPVEPQATPDQENGKEKTPKPVYIRKSVVNVGLKVPVSHHDFTESEPDLEPVRVRPLRSRSPNGRERTPEFESRGTKVYIQRRKRSKQDESESSFTAPSSADKPGTASTDITTPNTSPPRPKSAPRERLRKARSGDEMPERPSTARRSKTPVDESAPKRHPSTTAEAFAKRITQRIHHPDKPPTPVPKVFGNRIEGWLDGMSDPFNDSRSMTPDPLDIPKKKSIKQQSPETKNDELPESRKNSAKRRSPRDEAEQRHSSGKRDLKDDLVSSSPLSPSTPTLKRRGAKHRPESPLKNRMSKDLPADNSYFADAVMSGGNPDAQRERRVPSAKKIERYRIPSGQKLTRIASDETLQTRDRGHGRAFPDDATTITTTSDGDVPRRQSTRRRVAKHDDLISVLSMPRENSRRVVPAKSIRRSRRKPGSFTVADIMNEVSTDELKYQRELRTLVEGVIPVLLKHAVAGPSESSTGSRVFSRPTTDPSVTRPIVDMGVALERLKTTHKHIPLHEPGELVKWAQSASKDYTSYLQAWRLGFKDVVVNLAPAAQRAGSSSWDHGLPRNADGDLVDNTGERVDVAYLLKRPLVRIKYLAKTFKDISQLQPSALAEDMAQKYQGLVAEAKRRVNDEHARLEDEAAYKVDATRARDPRSLAPITGVTIDSTRSVRARDYYDMDLVHSSGQQLGCKIELIYRDDAPNRGKAGDVLFCEVSVSGRWLLFPPLPHALVSARKGDRPGELVVMIRGFMSNASQWREIMSLRAEEDSTATEWLQMLGSSPMPPKLARKSSFNMYKQKSLPAPGAEEPKLNPITETAETSDKSRDPSPREIEVPIGVRAKSSSRIWDGSEVNSVLGDDNLAPTRSQHHPQPARYRSQTVSAPSMPDDIHHTSRDHAAGPQYSYDRTRDDTSSAPSRRRPLTSHTRSHSEWTGSTVSSERTADYSVWMPTETASRYSDESSDGESQYTRTEESQGIRPRMHRRTSSVPSLDMPSIPKVRKSPRSDSAASDRDGLPSQKRAYETSRADDPSSAPPKLQQRLSVRKRGDENDRPPAPPSHRDKPRPLSLGQALTNKIPSLTPAFLKKSRRPSSPLKHEYAPSSASDSLSDSDYSDYSDGDSVTSESTIDERDVRAEAVPEDEVSTVGDLRGFHDYKRMGPRRSPPPAKRSPPPATPSPVTEPSTRFSMPGPSLGPSESASQGPYRSVPDTGIEPAKTVASIFSWSDRGAWDSLHMEECQIFVTPGLIEAFDLTQANSVAQQAVRDGLTPSALGVKPLVALELTPLVPLRRSTAVDITVRSPPTTNSLYKPGANIMFRSRSPEDCERLYTLLNRARIDNPTYVALQQARGPVNQSNWGEIMDQNRDAQLNKRRSWWNLGSRKSSTYRSSGSRAQSTAATESSVGTTNTAFSALRRFSGSSKFFDLAKSTITSREGTRSTNSGSLNSGTATPDLQFDPSMGTPIGITGSKVRLYVRESASKWRDLGSARLTVMLPARPDPNIPANPRTTGLEKRILVTGKSQNETLLDVTLGENAFERIARTGIAVSVYQESEHVGTTGGVLPNRTTCYMIQMKSERDAAYTFGLVGKLRY
ncbi:hypothetical protein Slin14017_G119190 [Septoria linicola]|nr:hypothetical protein Slin14017_G119190 [Septoria linicola]